MSEASTLPDSRSAGIKIKARTHLRWPGRPLNWPFPVEAQATMSKPNSLLDTATEIPPVFK